ncbi:nucleotide sugar dehydrogenase [Aestuariicoccus sp. MJ-SS9]|uniref:nucleotide sugar dehydrogenase n=1 Tax=Aestuariicoccus sp. MJ-SS9 TaxID=3079855 RepID=UPI002907B0C1|nr:nucleotide sugar dehydrogenase [Aestuariicoccus sp. MJ-SS9]MDU8914004.1 nucleotide sugar dehydrogenase [Aestuariicoccus sp. MJ-SS9]
MSTIARLPDLEDTRIAVIGLGYVGLPLAVEFARVRPTVGFDINEARIASLCAGHDATGEVEAAKLKAARHLSYTSRLDDLAECNVYIVSVPTPIDMHRQPDLTPLIRASETVGKVIARGDVVIYESTVYPGATEDDCLPVVERVSGLRLNHDFYAGYSPERINPGDKARPLPKIMKVTSGSTPEAADLIDRLYNEIITAGTFKAASIRVAEASKVIENTQRDVNIALINELSMVFSRLGIDTNEVLDAAATKWNFTRYTPGLVGGHCIGVDPYYLVHKSMAAGHIPDIIRQSREINDGMPRHTANRLVREMARKGLPVGGARVLMLGLTFKENCPDIRNTKVVDLVCSLEDFGMRVDICDPWADAEEVRAEFGRDIVMDLPAGRAYDVVIAAVAHDRFTAAGAGALRALHREGGLLFDMKAAFPRAESDLRL